MAASVLDLDIAAGGEFLEYVTYYDATPARVNLTGYTAALKIRDAGDNSVLLSITTTGSGTTSRIKLSVDSTQNAEYGEVSPSSVGVITIYINATDTAALSGKSGVYDLILTPSGGAGPTNSKPIKGSVNSDTLVTV